MSGADNSSYMISDFGEFLSTVTMECQCELGLEQMGFQKKKAVGESYRGGILGGGKSIERMLRQENMDWNFSLAETES